MSRVKYTPGMGSAPPESRLMELLLPPPMVGLKMGAVGTTAALTVAERDRRIGGGVPKVLVGPKKGSWPSKPQGALLHFPSHYSKPLFHSGGWREHLSSA